MWSGSITDKGTGLRGSWTIRAACRWYGTMKTVSLWLIFRPDPQAPTEGYNPCPEVAGK